MYGSDVSDEEWDPVAIIAQEFPPWKTVYDHFSQWNRRGVWEKVIDQLNRKHRKKWQRANVKLRFDQLTKCEDHRCL